MGAILEPWDRLKSIKPENVQQVTADQWKQFSKDAGRVHALLKRSARTETADELGGEFQTQLTASAQAAVELGQALRQAARSSDEAAHSNIFAAMKRLGTTCGGCHREYRN